MSIEEQVSSIKLSPRVLFKRFKKVPYKQQMKDTDCGPACLAMILNYYGYMISVTESAKACESYGVGISTRNIINASKEFGLDAKLYSVELNHLEKMHYPMIIHWEFNHFVVLEKIEDDKAIIIDPAFGRRTVPFEEFDQSFTGMAVTLVPTNKFKKRKGKSNVRFRHTIKSIFFDKSIVMSMFKIIATVLVLQGLTLSSPLLFKYIIDHAIAMKFITAIEALSYAVIFFTLLTFCITYIRARLIVKIQTVVDKNLVEKFIERLVYLPVSFFLQRSSGDIQSRVNSNTVIRDALSSHTISTFLDGLFTIGYAILLFMISPKFCLLVSCLGGAQIAVFGFLSTSVKDKISAEVKVQANYQSYLVELIHGITTIKSTASEGKVLNKFKKLFSKYLIVAKNRSIAESLVNSTATSLKVASPIIILLYSTSLYFSEELTLGTLIAINSIANLFLLPLINLSNVIRHLQLARIHSERIGEIWLHNTEKEEEHNIANFESFESFSVNDLSFSYYKGDVPILKNINFEINKGEKVAIVGATGSGKTTLMSILLGFIKPTSGVINLNGHNLHDHDMSSFRKKFGVVPQTAFLFNASIKDNIAICNPNTSLSQIEYASELACLDQDVAKFPMAYETLVGEGGDLLSGGQKQRLSIARAIVSNPSLLFLDEATSSLDSTTEMKVSKNLSTLENTQIIVSHRISTIKSCNKIIVLDGGCLIAIGSHKSLMSTCVIYQEMVTAQMIN